MNELDLIQESEASKEAKKLGLVHHGGPYYKDPKTDKVVAKSVEGGAQLKMIGSSEAPDSGGADDDEQSSSSGFEVDGVEVAPDGLPVEINSLVDSGKIDITTSYSGGQDVQVIWFDDWADGKGDLKVGFVASDGKAYSYLTGEELTADHIERMKNQKSIDYMQKLVDKKKEMGVPNTGAIMTALQDEKGVWNTTETLKKLNKQQAEKPFTMPLGKPIEDDPAKKKKYSPTKAKVKAAKMGLIKQPEPLKYKDKEVQIYRMKIGDEGKDTPVGFVASDGVLYSFVTGKKLTKATLDKIKTMGHKQYISKVSGKHYLKMIDKVDKEIGVGSAPTQQAPTKEPEPAPTATPAAIPKKKKKSNYATKKAKEAGLEKTVIKLGNGPDAKEIEAYSMMIYGQMANVGFVGSDGKLYSLLTGKKLTMATVNKIKKMGFSKYMSSLKPAQWQKYIDDVEKEVGIVEIPDDPPQVEPEKVLPAFTPTTDNHPKGAVAMDQAGMPEGFTDFIKNTPGLSANSVHAFIEGEPDNQLVTKILYDGFQGTDYGVYIGFLGPDGIPLSYETGEPITQAYLDQLKTMDFGTWSNQVFVAKGGAKELTKEMHKKHGFWDISQTEIDPQMHNWPDSLFLDEKDTKPCPDCGCPINVHDVHEYCNSDFWCNSKKEHRSCFTEHPNASKNDKADNKITAQDAEPSKKAPDLEAKVEKASTVDGLEKESEVETVMYWDYQSASNKEAKLHFYNNKYGQPVAVVGGDGKLYSVASGGQKKYTKATHKKWGNKPTIYIPSYKKEHIAKHIAKTWPEFAMTGKMTAPDPEDVKPKTMKASQLEGLEAHESEIVPIQTYLYGQGYVTTQYKVTYYKNTAGKIVAVKGGDGKLYSVASGGKKKYTAATHKKYKDKSYGAGMWNWDSTTGGPVSDTIKHLAQLWPFQFDPQGKGAPTKAQAKAAEKKKQAKEDEKLVDTSIQITKDNEPAATKTSEAGAKYTKNAKFYKTYTKAMQMGLTPKWSNTFKNIAFTNKLGKAVAIIDPDTNGLMSTVTGKAYTLATHKKFKDEIADKDKQQQITDAYSGGKQTLSDIDADMITPVIATKDTIDNTEEVEITVPSELMLGGSIYPMKIRAWAIKKLTSDPKKALSDPTFRSMDYAFRLDSVYDSGYRKAVYKAMKHVQDNPDQFTDEEREYINEAFNDSLHQFIFTGDGDYYMSELQAVAPNLTEAMKKKILKDTIETPFKSFMSSLPTSIKNQVNKYRMNWQGSGQYTSSIKGQRNKYFNEHLKGAKFPSRFSLGNGLTFNSHMYRGMSMSTPTATKFLNAILKGGKDSAFTLPPSGFSMAPQIANSFAGNGVSMHLRLESQDDNDEMYGFQISHDNYMSEKEVIRTGTMKQKIKRVRKYTFKTQSGSKLPRVIYKVDMIDLHEHETDPDLISEKSLAEWMAKRARELVFESEASDEAKKRGLKHKHGPYYADAQGNIVAKAVDGGAKLADVKPGEVDGEQGDEEEQQPPQQQQKSVEDRAKEGDVAAQLKVQADKKEKNAKKGKKGPSMTKEEKKKKALKVAQRTLKDVTKFIYTVQGDPLEDRLLKPQGSLEIKETLTYYDVAKELEFEYIDELDEDDINDNTSRGAVLRSMFGYDISLSPFLPRMVNAELTNADAVKKAQSIVGNEKVLDFMIASRSTFMNSIPSESSRINPRIIIHNQLQVIRNVIGMLPKDHQYLGVLTEWQEDLEQTQQVRSNAFFGYVTTPLRRKTFSAFSRTGRFGEDPKDSVDLQKGVEWDGGRPVWAPKKWSKMRSLSVAVHLWQEYGGHGLNSEEEGLSGINDWISENVNSETSRFPAKTDDGKPVTLSRGMRFHDPGKAKAFMQSLIKQGDEIELPNSGFSYDPTVPHRFSDLKPWYNDTVSVTIKVHPRTGQEEFVGLSLMDLVQDAYNDEAEVILPSTNKYKFKGYEAIKTPPQGVTYVVHVEDATEM